MWIGRSPEHEEHILDDTPVPGITATLDAASRIKGNPHRLAANNNRAFIGSYVLGKGFILTAEQAQELLDKNIHNRDVIFPYLNGEDLNQRWNSSASRWVINFHNWPKERAQTYEDVFPIVERDVKPFRARNRDPRRQKIWWQFTRPTIELYKAIEGLDRVLVIALTSKTQIPLMVPNGQVFDQTVVVFSTSSFADLTLHTSQLPVRVDGQKLGQHAQ